MIDRGHELSVSRQAQLLELPRSTVYYLDGPTGAAGYEAHAREKVNSRTKLVFTALSAVIFCVGLVAIVTETHTATSRFEGYRTVVGADAVWVGQTAVLLAILPVLVWLPKRWVGLGVSMWWVALMAWLFLPFALR